MMAAVNPTIRDRIIASAEELYNAAARQKLPAVGDVRRHSGTSMSDCCHVMQEWRRLQTKSASAPTVEIPDRVLQASNALIRGLWQEAQTNANESLMSAQVSWDKDRAEGLQVLEEVNAAFEVERTENEGLRARLAQIETELKEARIVAATACAHSAILEGKCQALEGQQAVLISAYTASRKQAPSKQAKDSEREKIHQDRG